jgi:branched-chain amino acid transport system ATP-binding protein
MLEVEKLNVHRGKLQVVWDASIEVGKEEIVVLIGANGAGKSTLLSTIAGLHRPSSGVIRFDGNKLNGLAPYRIVNLGISFVPEDRKIFSHMDVRENLRLGSYSSRAKAKMKKNLGTVYEVFPVLKERQNQLVMTLSGGEQRMLAIARGLMSNPVLLVLDEPSQGLSPKLTVEVFKAVEELRKRGLSILLAEQNVSSALDVADRAYVMETGRITLQGECKDIEKNDYVKEAFLGL